MAARFSRAFICVLLLGTSVAGAGQLALAWPAAEGDRVAGYRVYVGTEPGVYDRSIDAGDAVRATVEGLADDVPHFFAVKAYDEAGTESESFSPELVSLPAPRIESIEPARLAPGTSVFVSLRGANFDPQLQVRLHDERLSVRSVVTAGIGHVILLLEAEATPAGEPEDDVILEPATFLLINPGRKADDYFLGHPEAVDLDGSGWIDDLDLQRVQASLGSHAGEDGYRTEADVDGDGSVDQSDLSRMVGRIGTPALWHPEGRDTRPVADSAAAVDGDADEPDADPAG